MSAPLHRRIGVLGVLAVSAVLAGCTGYGTTTSVGVGFYRPWGYSYGGWNRGYFVGPPPRGWVGPGRRSFRSIPSRPRRGGFGRRRR